MKRTLKILALMAIVTILTISGVKASSSTLANDLYSKLSAYGMSAADKVKVERYIASNNVTDEQATTVLAKADAAVEVMKEENITDYKKLSAESKAKVEALAKEAASAVGATLVFEDGVPYLQDPNGNVIPLFDNGKLSYTGNNMNTVLVVSSIAVIALAAVVVTRKIK